MAKRRTGTGKMKRTTNHKTVKRLETKRMKLEELAEKRSKNVHKRK